MHSQAIPQTKHRAIFLSIIGILVFLIFSGAICNRGGNLPPPKKVGLEIWRSEDTSEDFAEQIATYQAAYPHVSITVKTLKEEEYEDALLTAWAKGEGPDIFSVPNIRLGKFREFISPMPESIKLTAAHVEKKFGKESLIVEEKTVPFPTISQLQDRFVDVVAEDVVFDGEVFGLPYSMDTLGLFYNRDLLAQAQVAVPPTTWEEFRNSVQAMVILDDEKNILQPAAALGTAHNIPYFFDILSLTMMQNGTTMVSGTGRAAFAQGVEERLPGVEALDFYNKFSDPAFKTYTWNDEQLDSLEAFTQGNLGFYFGYFSDFAKIKDRSPNLNFSYTKFPQIDQDRPVNIARYPVEAVHINSENPEHAWNFIQFVAGEQQAKVFTEKTGRIPALRSLIGEKQTDPEVGVFAQQALTAESWYHGSDPDAAVGAFVEMVDATIAATLELSEIIGIAQAKVQLTLE